MRVRIGAAVAVIMVAALAQVFGPAASQASAQTSAQAGQTIGPDQIRMLGDALLMDRTLGVMQAEAIQNAKDVAVDLFGVPDMPEWTAAVGALFSPDPSRAAFDAAAGGAAGQISAADHAGALAFFTAPLGQRILELELDARAQMIDDAVEAAATEGWSALQRDPMPASATRADLIREIIAANDLIETNVASALNGNLAFYSGLADANGAGSSTDDMLREVWSQEGQIREDTENWLYPFLNLAYAPLTEAELRSYIDFSKSSAGQALNRVLFAAFDSLGAQQSRGMGLAAGRLMLGQDI